MKINELKKKYKNKWILAYIIKEDKEHNIQDVKPLVISADKQKVYDHLTKLKKGSHVATIYTGQSPPKGQIFTFYVRVKI